MPKKPTIVIVDDDPVGLNTVISILGDIYNCVPIPSGIVALKFFEKHTADLVILDYNMPQMNGIEVLRALQENEKTDHIPVIFVTGVDDEDGEVSALREGASDYVLKPIRPTVLVTRVKNQLELYVHRMELQKLVDEKTADLNRVNEILTRREESTLNLLARITDMRDEDTGNHIMRTTEYTRVIVEAIYTNPRQGYFLNREQADSIVKCAKLHDLGKIAIPDKVLLKPGKLTPEEFEVIKKHPIYGEKFFADFIQATEDDPFLETAREITYSHHEKWSGAGYPLGLKGDAIPLSGRIVALADVYDALTSERPYKKAFTHEVAKDIITEDSGKHFDPYIVELFLANEQKFIEISKMRSSH
ncbi:MAG: response regulator [Ruminococcus sp.]|jgi:putative two-component system response regulator|nr:response regulator [Ruminococcus sp.]